MARKSKTRPSPASPVELLVSHEGIGGHHAKQHHARDRAAIMGQMANAIWGAHSIRLSCSPRPNGAVARCSETGLRMVQYAPAE